LGDLACVPVPAIRNRACPGLFVISSIFRYMPVRDGDLRMVWRVSAIVVLTALSLALAGCGPCGFDGWSTACRGEPAPK
jgi:hypothetical protein